MNRLSTSDATDVTSVPTFVQTHPLVPSSSVDLDADPYNDSKDHIVLTQSVRPWTKCFAASSLLILNDGNMEA